MKKLNLFLVLILALVLCGCGHKHEYQEEVMKMMFSARQWSDVHVNNNGLIWDTLSY